jgi:coproporphyrinogen III oxidase
MANSAEYEKKYASWEDYRKSPEFRRAQLVFVDGITQFAVTYGLLKTKGLARDELRKKAVGAFLKAKNKKILFTMDHSDTLTSYTQDFVKRGHFEAAVLMQATWLEHGLNQIVQVYGKRHKLTEQEVVQVIREVNFRGKIGWLFKLLKAPAIPEEHVRAMTKLIEARNEFAHYKWKGSESLYDAGLHYKEVLTGFSPTVRFLERYIKKHIRRNYEKENPRNTPS